MILTALAIVAVPLLTPDMPLIDAAKHSAPVCIEACIPPPIETSLIYQGLQLDAYQDAKGWWKVGLSCVV